MSAENFREKLRKTSLKQDAGLSERFKRADNVLLKAKGDSAVVRDTFSMPPDDYALIESLRASATQKTGQNTTKNEVIRAGLRVLSAMSSSELVDTLSRLQKVKPGRKI